MTEPGAGSDLSGIATRAVRDGDAYVLNGSKTFISNGQNAGLVVVAAKTLQDRHRGLSLAVTAVSAAEGVLARTMEYVTSRKAFGQPVGSFQHRKFLLAEVDIARVFVDHCVALHSRKEVTAARAAKAKYWCSELQVRVADRCLQLHGGYGYMREYADARVQTIYGGTTEIMKEIIGRDLGL